METQEIEFGRCHEFGWFFEFHVEFRKVWTWVNRNVSNCEHKKVGMYAISMWVHSVRIVCRRGYRVTSNNSHPRICVWDLYTGFRLSSWEIHGFVLKLPLKPASDLRELGLKHHLFSSCFMVACPTNPSIKALWGQLDLLTEPWGGPSRSVDLDISVISLFSLLSFPDDDDDDDSNGDSRETHNIIKH